MQFLTVFMLFQTVQLIKTCIFCVFYSTAHTNSGDWEDVTSFHSVPATSSEDEPMDTLKTKSSTCTTHISETSCSAVLCKIL